MVIIAGHVVVEPQQRERYLADCVGVIELARQAPGCLDFAVSADLVDAGRVGSLERELASARAWAFSIAFVLAAEAAFLDALDGWLNRRPSVARIVPRAVVGVGYLLTLALAIEANPTSSLWELNDDSALDRLVPARHFPALVAVGVVTLMAVIGWLAGASRDGPDRAVVSD
ncbi:putative quinol monooxygenase [Nonomuraea sp. AD125B]|uniref:putative quinol monooxygenase n=1 Tax=Nonomuraea sp. AD125B TaxID=3242897 RepID=UPI0035287EAF